MGTLPGEERLHKPLLSVQNSTRPAPYKLAGWQPSDGISVTLPTFETGALSGSLVEPVGLLAHSEPCSSEAPKIR
jgi:hypothetical protein